MQEQRVILHKCVLPTFGILIIVVLARPSGSVCKKGVKRKLPVVFSTEQADSKAVLLTDDERNKKSTCGTVSYMPAVFGCYLAEYVIKDCKIMIHLEGITKSFGSLQVLKGIDLEITQGEVVSIVGPSGAGRLLCFR